MRNIIAPFEGYLVDLQEQLSDDDADREDERALVALALSRLEHITRLIDDLGVYSAPTAADFSPTNLDSVVREAIAVGADRGEQTAELDLRVQRACVRSPALPPRRARATIGREGDEAGVDRGLARNWSGGFERLSRLIEIFGERGSW
jgi:hypothetical protein